MGTGFTGGFTPRPFPRSGAIIAPYWADADATVGSGRTYYREGGAGGKLPLETIQFPIQRDQIYSSQHTKQVMVNEIYSRLNFHNFSMSLNCCKTTV